MVTSVSKFRSAMLMLLIVATSFAAVLAVPAQEAAAGTGPGYHDHGYIGCNSGGSINVSGSWAQRNGTLSPGGTSTVYYQATLYRWNGTSWAYVMAAPWKVGYPYGYGKANFTQGFTVYKAGQYRVQTQFQWYDYRGAVYYGNSVGWVSGGSYCTYR